MKDENVRDGEIRVLIYKCLTCNEITHLVPAIGTKQIKVCPHCGFVIERGIEPNIEVEEKRYYLDETIHRS